jgi:tetratricopeptide (TPR) repeat protein
MIDGPDVDSRCHYVTDGEIAAINLESARRRSWERLVRDPAATGVAELIVEQEQMAAQFFGDFGALGRLEALATHLAVVDAMSARTALVQAQVASTTHRFAEARIHLALATERGASAEAIDRLTLSIDQACGTQLDAVLEARRSIAAKSRSLEDLVPLGALLADLHEFDQADETYQRGLYAYRDVSPFAVAWVFFQLGMLWGDFATNTDANRAARWYRHAIEYLPRYVKARVHLAEICADCGHLTEAESLLVPVLSSGDPEVTWRLADVLALQGRRDEATAQLGIARSRFDELLARHQLAFADHGAEFYAGSGNDAPRALDLARINVANRLTLRAYEQAYAIAVDADEADAATKLMAEAAQRWGSTDAFRRSTLASVCRQPRPKGVSACGLPVERSL